MTDIQLTTPRVPLTAALPSPARLVRRVDLGWFRSISRAASWMFVGGADAAPTSRFVNGGGVNWQECRPQ